MHLKTCALVVLTSILAPSVALPCSQQTGWGPIVPNGDREAAVPANASAFATLWGVEFSRVRAHLVEDDVLTKLDVEMHYGLLRVPLRTGAGAGDRIPGGGEAPPANRGASLVLSVVDTRGPVEPISIPLNMVDLTDLRPPVFGHGFSMTNRYQSFAPCGSPGFQVQVELDPVRDDYRIAGVALFETSVHPPKLVMSRVVTNPNEAVRLFTNAGTVRRRVCYEARAFDGAGNESIKDLGCMNLGAPTIDAGVIDAGGPTSSDAGTNSDTGTNPDDTRRRQLPTAAPSCTCSADTPNALGLSSVLGFVMLLGLGLRKRKFS